MRKLMTLASLLCAACLYLPSPDGLAAKEKKDGEKKTETKPDKKPVLKVEAEGLEYELTGAKVNNQNLELSLSVVSPSVATTLQVQAASAYTEDGKVYSAKFRALSKEAIRAKMPVGQKVQVKVNLGTIPDGVKALSTIELQCSGGKKKGSYNVVFKNVAVER